MRVECTYSNNRAFWIYCDFLEFILFIFLFSLYFYLFFIKKTPKIEKAVETTSNAKTKNMGMISGYLRINEANWVQFGQRCGKCVLTRFWPKRQICGKPGQEFPNHEFFEPKPHLATSQERMANFIKFDSGSPNIRKSHLIQSSLSLFTDRERAPTTSSIQTSGLPYDTLSGPDGHRYERQASYC